MMYEKGQKVLIEIDHISLPMQRPYYLGATNPGIEEIGTFKGEIIKVISNEWYVVLVDIFLFVIHVTEIKTMTTKISDLKQALEVEQDVGM